MFYILAILWKIKFICENLKFVRHIVFEIQKVYAFNPFNSLLKIPQTSKHIIMHIHLWISQKEVSGWDSPALPQCDQMPQVKMCWSMNQKYPFYTFWYIFSVFIAFLIPNKKYILEWKIVQSTQCVEFWSHWVPQRAACSVNPADATNVCWTMRSATGSDRSV